MSALSCCWHRPKLSDDYPQAQSTSNNSLLKVCRGPLRNLQTVGKSNTGAEIRLVVVKTGTSKENWAILATARHHPNISAVGAHNFKPARKVKAGLQVVRRKIVMDRAQTLPPRQAVLKMACEFILEPLMDARNRCMLPSDIQQSNPDDLCRDLGEYDISARCPWSDPV